jgi:dipeptidyl aminopeptidase/acylaminoacyl peptidase
MRARSLIAVLLPVLLASSLHAQKRGITEKDLFDFHWIGDTQRSPDGSRAVFVQANVDAKREGYETSLYLLDLTTANTQPRKLTNGPRDTQPRWSPDGTQIAFIRAVEKDGKPQPGQVFLLSLAGGDPQPLPALDKGARSPLWSPDGTALAVLSETPIVAEPKKPEPKEGEKAEKKEPEHKSDVRIITHVVYRSNGSGYVDYKEEAQLYLYTLPHDGKPATAARPLTTGHFGVEDFLWATDSKQIYFTTERVDDPAYDLPHNELDAVAIPAATAEKNPPAPAFTLVAQFQHAASGLALSPDGKRIAFHSDEQPAKPRSHQQPDLFVFDLDTPQTTPRNLTAKYDYEMGGGVGGDNTAPRGGGRGNPIWTPDGKSILDLAGKRGSAIVVSVDASTGAVAELTAAKQAVLSFALMPDAKLLTLISTPINIGDLFLVNADKSQTQLTQVNEPLFSKLNLTQPQDLLVTPTVNAKDIPGEKIETFVQLPPDFDASKKYPLILNIHGGPHSAYGWVFDHEMQWMAAKGYVVVYPNPRGSTTYGQQFANVIQHNYPGDDFHDLMDSVDAVIKLGYVDTAKLGITGGSGGGLLTDWTVTQTNRFKAAVAQRDITDWANWWYTADFTLFQPTWFEGAPFDHPEEFKKYSPITYVKNIQTPMMFILGDADYRTPPTAGGEDFYRALKYRHIDTVMLRFPGESHELSRSGQPWHRIERLENIVDWFDKYLMGTPEPQYDLVPAAVK